MYQHMYEFTMVLPCLIVCQIGIEPEFILFIDCPKEELERRILNRNQVLLLPFFIAQASKFRLVCLTQCVVYLFGHLHREEMMITSTLLGSGLKFSRSQLYLLFSITRERGSLEGYFRGALVFI